MDRDWTLWGCLWAVAILAFVFVGVMNYVTVKTISGTVVDTKIDRGNTYFIFQQDGSTSREMLENEDNWLFLKFNSGDFLMMIEKGKHYSLKVNWIRFPVLSWYRNILRFSPSPTPEK